jgi:hypothetical protein
VEKFQPSPPFPLSQKRIPVFFSVFFLFICFFICLLVLAARYVDIIISKSFSELFIFGLLFDVHNVVWGGSDGRKVHYTRMNWKLVCVCVHSGTAVSQVSQFSQRKKKKKKEKRKKWFFIR